LFGTHDLWLFVLSGLLLNITPGPDTLYIVGRSSTQGRRAGAVAALGIGLMSLLVVQITTHVSRGLAPGNALRQWLNRCVGAVFIAVGVRLALAHDR
jgi:threonine/homoserine/homoserine lactone efflux protein